METYITDDPALVPSRENLEKLIKAVDIRPFFQPIVDLFSGEIYGYEVLSRGAPPFEQPLFLFSEARKHGLSWDVERACRVAAFQRISVLIDSFPRQKFFVNISPHIFGDPRFRSGFTRDKLEELGVDQRRIVLEITETSPVEDYHYFRSAVQHYCEQGFSIALDDFGAGHSSLITLVAASPNYVKLDRGLVEDIHNHAYKQHLVKSVLSFASNVDSSIIAEGVETEDELETLIRLGVRFAQGYLLDRPKPEPASLKGGIHDRLQTFFEVFHYPHVSNENSIASICLRPKTCGPQELNGTDLDLLFRKHASVDHVVMLENNYPTGILTRQHFYNQAGGPFGFSLIQRRPICELIKSSPLIVNERMEVAVLGRLAMNRQPADLYDPVLVVNGADFFVGSITMKQLLNKFLNSEIQTASDSNPLTNLPGNRQIQQWLQKLKDDPPFTIVYADLDRFKEYNDAYGFSQGDKMIQLGAQVLTRQMHLFPKTIKVGHLGGDDYVLVAREILAEEILQTICDDFDREKQELFKPDDFDRGTYLSVNRQGEEVDVPISTISLAVITSENLKGHSSLEQIALIASSLKKTAKAESARARRSTYLLERRNYS